MEEIVLEVTDLSRGGAGVARDSQGRVVFIPYAAPGDQVRARLVKLEKKYAQAELLEVLRPSVNRKSAPCPVFGKCGGCQWQHLDYSFQWETKLKGVSYAMERAGLVVPEQFDKIPADRIWEYRNKVQLRGFHNQLGFFRTGSNEIIPVDRCEIARPEINQLWEEVRKEGSRFKKPFKVEVEVLPDGKVLKTWNSGHSASGFRQVHDEQNEKLKQWIFQNLPHRKILWDLFGGSGNLSFPWVGVAAQIHSIDLGAPAERPPDFPSEYYFYRSSVNTALNKIFKSHENMEPGVAILDPPRIGLVETFSEIEQSLKHLNVQELVAVGCDLDSWIRDVSRFQGQQWKLQKMMAIDLFPQTRHIETVALLVRD